MKVLLTLAFLKPIIVTIVGFVLIHLGNKFGGGHGKKLNFLASLVPIGALLLVVYWILHLLHKC